MATNYPLEVWRVEGDTATRISYRLGVEDAAITVFDTSDAKTVADQLRALAERIDPQGAREWPPRTRRRRSPF